jgi:predicted SAM-dependent methyltransferase
MEFRNTKVRLSRPLSSYSKIRSLVSRIIRGRRLFIRRSKSINSKYLDIGCGPNTAPDFINLDYSWAPGVDICWDVTKGLPLDDHWLYGIFSEHCFEHISFRDLDFVLSECWRVLRPNGRIRVVMPDGELYLTRYVRLLNGDTSCGLPYNEDDRYENIYSPIISVNRIFRSHGHTFIYDFDCLRCLLEKNGFTKIEKLKFATGANPTLFNKDSKIRELESFYVEAIKKLP